MFLDASAAIAILAREEDHATITDKLASASVALISPLSYYETCVGLARALSGDPAETAIVVQDMLKTAHVQTIDLTEAIGIEAVNAHMRFGKGRHKANLNMGDCFAYACARLHKVPLLCKGNDFVHTDIELA